MANWTKELSRCNVCHLNIRDDNAHWCSSDVSYIRPKSIYAKDDLWPLFSFNFEGEFFAFNQTEGRFCPVVNGEKLLSSATNGLLSFEINGISCVATYKACSFKRFSIIFAMECDNGWETLFRATTTPFNGLQLIDLDPIRLVNGEMTLPQEYNLNVIAILGIKPISNSVNFDIFANEDGLSRDGYKAGWILVI